MYTDLAAVLGIVQVDVVLFDNEVTSRLAKVDTSQRTVVEVGGYSRGDAVRPHHKVCHLAQVDTHLPEAPQLVIVYEDVAVHS